MELSEQLIKLTRQSLLSRKVADFEVAANQAMDELAASGNILNAEAELLKATESALVGFGPLQFLLDDDEVEEIWINQPNQVIYSRNGRTEKLAVVLDDELLQTYVHRLLRFSNRRVDRVSPFADATTESGHRLHVVIPDVTAKHWAVNLRKHRAAFRKLSDLVKAQMLSEQQAAYLTDAMLSGKNILIAGPTQAGKTTLLSALLNELPPITRLITCEETFEIKCSLSDWVAMQTRQANLEGTGEIPLRRLVKEALRMRPDRLVIGEVREAESLDLLLAMNSGLPGLCTLHANSAQAALEKLSTLPLLAGPNITSAFVIPTIAQSIDFIVQLGFKNERRALLEIAQVKLIKGQLAAEQVQL